MLNIFSIGPKSQINKIWYSTFSPQEASLPWTPQPPLISSAIVTKIISNLIGKWKLLWSLCLHKYTKVSINMKTYEENSMNTRCTWYTGCGWYILYTLNTGCVRPVYLPGVPGFQLVFFLPTWRYLQTPTLIHLFRFFRFNISMNHISRQFACVLNVCFFTLFYPLF